MSNRVCPWWLGYFLASPVRRWAQGDPAHILSPYVREGMTVLEPGPGMGFFTIPLAHLVGTSGRVVAVDLQPKMLAALKRRAAKAGVLNLTRAMAIDYGKHNIRVNCVCPGDVDTPMLVSECRQLGENPAQFMKEAAQRPLGRVGTPDDVANAVLFLASDMAKWITGAHLVVDGGGIA